jgi:hypothetical protein
MLPFTGAINGPSGRGLWIRDVVSTMLFLVLKRDQLAPLAASDHFKRVVYASPMFRARQPSHGAECVK